MPDAGEDAAVAGSHEHGRLTGDVRPELRSRRAPAGEVAALFHEAAVKSRHGDVDDGAAGQELLGLEGVADRRAEAEAVAAVPSPHERPPVGGERHGRRARGGDAAEAEVPDALEDGRGREGLAFTVSGLAVVVVAEAREGAVVRGHAAVHSITTADAQERRSRHRGDRLG